MIDNCRRVPRLAQTSLVAERARVYDDELEARAFHERRYPLAVSLRDI
jgi:hypothetical protein